MFGITYEIALIFHQVSFTMIVSVCQENVYHLISNLFEFCSAGVATVDFVEWQMQMRDTKSKVFF